MLKKVIFSGIGLALIGVSRLVFNATALNFFGEDTAGALNVGLSLAILVALPVTSALGAPTVRFVAEARGRGAADEASALLRMLLAACLLGAIAVVLGLAPFVDRLARWRGVETPVAVVALVIAVVYPLYHFVRNALYAVDRVATYSRLEFAAQLSFFAAVGVAVVAGTPLGLLLAFAIAYAVFVVGGLSLLWGELRTVGARAPTAGLLGFATYGLIGSTASLGTSQLAVLWAPQQVGLDAVAYLSLSLSLLTPLAFLPRMLRTVVFSESAERSGRGDAAGLSRSLSEVSHWLLVLNTPLTILVLILAGPILSWIGGSPTAEHVLVLRILAVTASVEIIATPAVNALPGTGNIALPAWSGVAGLVAAILVWYLAVPQLGLTGLALGLLASGVVKTAPPVIRAITHLGLRLTRRPITGALLVVLGLIALGVTESWRPIPVALAYALAAAGILRTSLVELWSRRAGRPPIE